MRTSSLGKDRRIGGFFRLFLGIIVSLTLAMGGMALIITPAMAQFNIVPPFDPPAENVTECQPFTIDFGFATNGVETCLNPPPAEHIYFWGSGNPGWVIVDQDTGILSGCVENGTAPGPITFDVRASQLYEHPGPLESNCPFGWPWWPSVDHYNVTLDVQPQAPCISINPSFVPVAWENVPFATTLSVTGGTGSYNWTATGLPAGLNLDINTGIVSGVPGPGTCGLWTVTVTCADTGTCAGPGCCPPVTAPLYLLVDCWANYLGMVTTYTSTTACDFTVNIGPGLAYGTTNVLIDGSPEATLAGNGSELFTSVPCESHLVVVDQTVQGPDPKTRYACIGSNQKWVSDIDSIAYFDYAPEIWIDTGSNPAGVAQPPGAGFYAAGAGFSSSAPSPVQPGSLAGTKYVFRQWSLPDGSTNPNRDLWFTVTNAGKATALYDTYYELILTSDFPAVLEKSWEPSGSNATWKLALQPIPFPNFFGGIGGVYEPVNAEGSHNMTGPYTQEIMWQENWFWPIFWIVLALLAIAAAIFFVVRSSRKRVGPDGTEGKTESSTQPHVDAPVKAAPVEVAPVEATPEKPAVSAIPEKKALTEAEQKDKPNFCPKCGSPVDEGSEFCKKCGNKL
jgi:hypothetical protein